MRCAVGYSTVVVDTVRKPPLPDRAAAPPLALPLPLHGLGDMRVLSRLTVELDHFTQVNVLRPTHDFIRAFDVVAVVPSSEHVLEAACKSGCVDIVRIASGSKLPFLLKKAQVRLVCVRVPCERV
jgi:RNase P/RNase MRP subunit p30